MSYQLFMDGFDYYATADLPKKWQVVPATSGVPYFKVDSAAGRRGGGCLYFNNGTGLNANDPIISRLFTPSTHVVVGFAIKRNSLVLANSPMRVIFYSGNVAQVEFTQQGNTLNWSARRADSATYVYSTGSNAFDVWDYIELGVFCSNTGSFELRINGSTARGIVNTAQDTYVSGSTLIDNIRISSAGTAMGLLRSIFWDDMYFAFGDELKFLGDSRIDTLNLTGNSTPQDWTPDTGNAWERLNQDAGYISSSTVNAVSLFNASDISHNPSLIHGVQVNGHAYKSDAGYRESAMVLKSGATTSVGTQLALSTDTLLIRDPYIVDPNTGAAFTKSGVNALEVGPKVTG
ncbi:MAG: hypothetical protein ACR2K1_07990 [Saprospiraceae bacterium]